MFFISLALAIGLLVYAIRQVRNSQNPIRNYLIAFAVCVIVPVFAMMAPEPAVLSGFFLIFVVILCSYPRRRPTAVIVAGVGVVLLTYAYLCTANWLEIERLLAGFPMESVELRLPVPPADTDAVPQTTIARLDALESEGGYELSRDTMRTYSLEKLHQHTVQAFIDRPGFGASRMSFAWTRLDGELGAEKTPPVPQPELPSTEQLSTGAAIELTDTSPPASKFVEMHRLGMFDFINARRFGFFLDRQHVAGFEPHRFTKLPDAPAPQRVRRVELVGLVTHPAPVVYVSENLPRMADLAATSKRPPDAFESLGLTELRDGNDLFVRETSTNIRVLGAVRALTQCTECHACERGRLLGAFSYTLSR